MFLIIVLYTFQEVVEVLSFSVSKYALILDKCQSLYTVHVVFCMHSSLHAISSVCQAMS